MNRQVRKRRVNWIQVAMWIEVIGLGLGLRWWRMKTELPWQDELFYWDVARKKLIDLVLVRHWLINHPPFYLLFEHGLHLIGFETIKKIRWFNLGFYLMSVWGLVKWGDLLKLKSWQKISGVLIYSLLPWFVGIEWIAWPYGMAIMWFIWSTYFGSKVWLKNEGWLVWAVTTLLFFYTSFEEGYVVGGVVVMGLIGWLVGWIDKNYLKQMGKWLVVVGGGMLGQLWILWSRLEKFPQLTTQYLRNPWGVGELIRGLIGMGERIWVWILLVGGVGVMRLMDGSGREKLKSDEEKMVKWLIGQVGVYFILIELGQEIFKQYGGGLKQPKAYYPVIFWLIWWLMIKMKKEIYFGGVVVGMSLIWWLNRNNVNWIMANYFYTKGGELPIELRSDLEEGKLDYVLRGKWQNKSRSDYLMLEKYYIYCFDLPKDKRDKCNGLVKHILTPREMEKVKGKKVFLWDWFRNRKVCQENECFFAKESE